MDVPTVFAHRGYSSRAPENTMAAFETAVAAGFPAIELDVHICATGEIVVIHDYDLSRTAGRPGRIEETPWEVLRSIDVGSWFGPDFSDQRVPLLSEMVSALPGDVFYDIEIKWPRRGAARRAAGAAPRRGAARRATGAPQRAPLRAQGILEAAVARIVAEHDLHGRCIVSSFNPLAIRRIERIDPDIRTALIYSHHMPFPLRRGQGRFLSKCRILKPHHALVTPSYMARFGNRLGYAVAPWTVDDPGEARRLRALGVDSIITNDPRQITKDC